VYWDSLERSRIKAEDFGPNSDPTNLTGLSRLIFLENILQEHRDVYRRKRLLKTIDESGEPALTSPSGYASHEIPYGEKFTAAMYSLSRSFAFISRLVSRLFSLIGADVVI
jgi:hypothetical protein